MAQHRSAIKRIRKSRDERAYNRNYRTKMRTLIKKVLQTTKKEEGAALYRQAEQLLDKMAAKKIIHRNKAANQKSRLARFVNKLA